MFHFTTQHLGKIIWSGVCLMFVLWVLGPQLLLACGTIAGEFYDDCTNPFGAQAGFPFELRLDGALVNDAAVIALNLDQTYEFTLTGETEEVIQAQLFLIADDDYILVPQAETASQLVSGVQFTTAGDYVLVVTTEDESDSEEAVFNDWRSWFVTAAHAEEIADMQDSAPDTDEGSFFENDESEPESDGTKVFVLYFTVEADTDSDEDDEAGVEVPCGRFIFSAENIQAVTDCENPFGMVQSNEVLHVTFTETVLTAGARLPLLRETGQFTIVGTDPGANEVTQRLFFHDGMDYRFESDLTGTYVFTATGTYTIVVTENLLTVSDSWYLDWWQKIVPTAHAAIGDVSVITFEVTEPADIEVCELDSCASSVLFLPGIQASRLYTRHPVEFENRIWEPFGNADVRKLEMTPSGVSVNDVYTRDILAEIFGVSNVYEGFMEHLETLVAEEVIADWQPFAYDWRYDVFSVVQNGTLTRPAGILQELVPVFPQQAVEGLAAESYSGKVTIVAHSNGGLLAKALMLQLEAAGKADLVDEIIFVGSPQLGTPKAIGTILHGYDQKQALGLIIDDEVAREVITNLPGAYGLLPGASYFAARPDPVISFVDRPVTSDLRNAYGAEITAEATLQDFMVGEADGRVAPATIYEPGLANTDMLTAALSPQRALLDAWRAPAGTKVTEVVGVGLDTEIGFEYQAFTERMCTAIFFCQNVTFAAPVPQYTQFGDQTVVGESAAGYQGEKETFYFDLKRLREVNSIRLNHSNITEAVSIQDLVTTRLTDDSVESIPFITDTPGDFATERVMLGAHSPVALRVVDGAGNVTGLIDGRIVTDIPGSSYREIAGSIYIIVPAGLDLVIEIVGEGEGGMTFTVTDLVGDESLARHHIAVATITESTIITSALTANALAALAVDTDGDGVIDGRIHPVSGELLAVIAETVPETSATQKGVRTTPRAPAGQVLGVAADTADLERVLLLAVVDLLEEHQQIGIPLSADDQVLITAIVTRLTK